MQPLWGSVSSTVPIEETEQIRRPDAMPNKKLLETLATFLPDQILNMPDEELSYKTSFSVLLLADLSGFTQLFEKCNRTGKENMHYLTATFNAHIGAVIEAISFYGGDILKFSGSGFLGMWKVDSTLYTYKTIHDVIVCALSIKSLIQKFSKEDNEFLKVSMAIACGDVTISTIGDDVCKEYVVVGPAVNNVKAALCDSVAGDIVIAATTWSYLAEENYDVIYGENGSVKVCGCQYKSSEKTIEYDQKELEVQSLCQKHIENKNIIHASRKASGTTSDKFIAEQFARSLLQQTSARISLNKFVMSDLRPYVFKAVQELVDLKQPLKYLTEIRNVTVQYISISPTLLCETKLVALMDNAYRFICKVVSRVNGIVSKMYLLDESATILVIYSSRNMKQDHESQNALTTAYEVRKALLDLEGVRSVSVAITKGLVYSGIIGHPFRKEYVIIGEVANKAVGMCRVYRNKVTCDHRTYQNSKLASCYFQLQSAVELKEVEDVGQIFEYNEIFDKITEYKRTPTLILGREGELDLINLVICHPEEAQGYRGVLFHGKPKTGKTRVLIAALESNALESYTVASACLCGPSQRPYYCVSVLYSQLLDKRTKMDSKRATKVPPRNLWDLNQILQDDAPGNRKQSITDTFCDLARGGISGFSVVFIDNVQYMDMQSLDVLVSTVRRGFIRLICAGEFEVNQWDIYWKMSLNDHIKLIELEALNRKQIALFVCEFLNVTGIYRKTVSVIYKNSEGRPGWVQAYLLGKINQGDLEVRYVVKNDENRKRYVFPRLQVPNIKHGERGDINSAVPVVELRDKQSYESKVTLAEISESIFHLLGQHEQFIVRTACVLGDIFTRSLLVTIMQVSDDKSFSAAIKCLFEEDIFDCGMKYINNTGLFVDTVACHCYIDEKEIRQSKEHRRLCPKYALCKLIHFKNRSLRTAVYQLLPVIERRKIHLRITDVIEKQDNLCQNCRRYNGAAIMKMTTFKEAMAYFKEEKDSGLDQTCIVENVVSTTEEKPCSEEKEKQTMQNNNVVRRKVWDSSTCFCLDILIKVYSNLVYQSQQADHLAKRIFYLTQYAAILSTVGEYEEAIPYLQQANKLCKSSAKDADSEITADCRRLFLGKIHMLLADANFKISNVKAAKGHLAVSLKQYYMTTGATKHTVVDKLFSRLWNIQKKNLIFRDIAISNLVMKSDFARYLSLLSKMLATEGYWELAKQFTIRSLTLLCGSKIDIALTCDAYSNALYIHNTYGDTATCEKLEDCVKSKVLRRWSGNTTVELYALSRLIFTLFEVHVLTGKILDAIKIAYRAMYVNNRIHAFTIQAQMLPVLGTMLIMVQRIDDAVNISQILRDVGRTYDSRALVGYYAFCVELNVETSFVLESVDKCEQFAKNYFSKLHNRTSYTPIEIKLIVYLQCYYIRKYKWSHASKWKHFYKPEEDDQVDFISVYNKLKFTECCLLLLVKDMQLRRPFLNIQERNIEKLLEECELASKKWRGFLPRTLHYKAYYSQIKERRWQAKLYLRSALKEARASKNTLEECWLNLSKNCWDGGFHFGNDMKDIDWKLATNYSALEWSQILYALPHNAL